MRTLRERRAALKVRIRRNGIYLLPNLFTAAALFFGFFAIVQAMNLRFEPACMAIFIAMVLDSLDGRVARMTRTQSAFGAEFDSLSDMVSFGAAPALVMYEWALKPLGKLGLVAAFIYCAGAALRLARFNVQIGIVDKRFFSGLPSPAAAALVAGFVWILHDRGIVAIDGRTSFLGIDVRYWALTMVLFAGISMVTTAKFYSFKTINLKKSVPFIVLALIAMGALALVALDTPTVLFAAFVMYGLSGYLYSAWRMVKPEVLDASKSGGPSTKQGPVEGTSK